MPTQWDDVMKSLVGENPQALVSFLLRGALYVGNLDRELKTRTIEADGLYDVKWNGESIILHVEFQRSRKSNMSRRVWEYNALTSIITRKLVYSVVIYLVKEKSITKPVYWTRFRNGHVTQWFSFHQIKLWELLPEVFEQPQLAGLLPLLPLTKNGQNYKTVDRMIDKMLQAGMQSQLWLAENIAGLVLKSQRDQQWIKERFHKMLPDILKESWVYKETIEEGKKQGIEQGIEQGITQDREHVILRLVELRFPSLLALARQVIERRQPLQQLQDLSDKLFLANTVEEVRTVLQAYEKEQ